jgi:undecaprenyl-diphosphatase
VSPVSRSFATDGGGRAGVVGLAVVLIAAIGLSRIYLGVHWITDVLTGWLLGGAWLAVCSTALLLARTPAVIAWRAR